MTALARATGSVRSRASPSLRLFFLAFILLQLSQVLQYPPGSDVSPYAFVTQSLRPNTVAGISVQTWALVFLTAVALVGALAKTSSRTPRKAFLWFAVAFVALYSIITASSVSNYLDGIGKLALPVVVYLYLSPRVQPTGRDFSAVLILWVNLFTVGQAFLSLLMADSFGGNTYYHELQEEYFGYYHHPFAFAGVLGICTLVAVFRLARGQQTFLSLALITANIWLVLQSEVRTFILALAVSLSIAVAMLLVRHGKVLWVVIASPLLLLALASVVKSGVATGRVTNDLSSGRVDRWSQDIQALASDGSPLRLAFGGGPQYIYELNELLFGVTINSLNLVIDILIDFGLVGVILFIAVWVVILLDAGRLGDKGLVASVAVFIVVSAMVTNAFEFPAVAVLFAIALTSFRQPKGLTPHHASTRTSSAAVSPGFRKRRMVGRGLYRMG